MKTLSLFLLAMILSASPVDAQPKQDTNIIISSAKEVYEFVYNKKAASVQVLQMLDYTYKCNDFRSVQPVFEYYNDKITMDEMEFYVDGKRNKNLNVKCDYYDVDGYFYSDERTCYMELPFIRTGSESEVVFYKTVLDPKYFTSVYFREPLKLKSKTVELKIPTWMQVEVKEINFSGFDIKKAESFDAKTNLNVITYTIKDAPAKTRESRAPGPSYVEPHLLILTKKAEIPGGSTVNFFNTVADQYSWYRSLVLDLKQDDESVKTKAQEISSGMKDDLEKIKATFYWVQNNIRYIAFEDGIAGFKPAEASDVLRKKYGDCKGMANLTKELLKAQGFDARLCWIGTNHIAYDYSTPALCVDNHMICGLNYKGQTYFLDATENYIGFGEYAERIQGRQVLMEEGEKYKLLNIPSTTAHQNQNMEKRILSIAGNDITGSAEHEWKGEEKEYILTQLNYIKKDKSADAFKKYLSNDNGDFVISDFKTSDLNNFDKSITASYQFTQKNAVSSFGKDMYVDLDFRKEYNDFIFKKDERVNDYWFTSKEELNRETVLNIPAGYTITSLPKDLVIKNDFIDIELKFTQQPGKLIYTKKMVLKDIKLPKKKFEDWNNDILKLQSTYNEQVVLTAK